MAYTLQSSPPNDAIYKQPSGSPSSAPISVPTSSNGHKKTPANSSYGELSSSPYDGSSSFTIDNNPSSANPYPTSNYNNISNNVPPNTFLNGYPNDTLGNNPVPSPRPSSIMLPLEELEESDHEFDPSSAPESNPNFNNSTSSFASRSYSPINANFPKKRYSAIYDSVTISNLAAAAAAGDNDYMLPQPHRPFSHRKSSSVSSNNSALLDSLLDTNVGKNLTDYKYLSAEPPAGPASVAPPQTSPNQYYPVHQLNKKPSWSSTHSHSHSYVPSGHGPGYPSLASKSSFNSLNGSYGNGNFQNTPMAPPFPSLATKSSLNSLIGSYGNGHGQHSSLAPPLPPFAGGSGGRSNHHHSASVGSVNSIIGLYSMPNANGSNNSVNSVNSVHSNNSAASTANPYNTNDLEPPTLNIPSRSASPVFATPPRSNSPAHTQYQPFNFQSTTMALGVPSHATSGGGAGMAGANPRRGHKYKHSSVSMNFFKEDVRLPLAIPASLPIPTLAECRQSMSRDQAIRVVWSAFHLFVAFLIYIVDSPYTALSALAHLLFYDAMGALLCSVVDILGNFDVWKRSSVHLPFGLERAEVLAGYALSISLIFMGGDIMSHSIQDVVQAAYLGDFFQASHSHGVVSRPQEHSATDGHGHGHGLGDSPENVDWNVIVFRVVLGIIVTVISAVGFDNHARIARALRNGYNGSSALQALPSFLSNPSHFITVTFSVAILLYPFESPIVRRISDTLLTPIIAVSMCYVGWSLAKSLGGMLVMSFPGENRVETVAAQVSKLPHVAKVEEVSVWQVHHCVWLACMKIEMDGGNGYDESMVRADASRLVKDIMNEGFETAYDEGNGYIKGDSLSSMNGGGSGSGGFPGISMYPQHKEAMNILNQPSSSMPSNNKLSRPAYKRHGKKNSVSAFAKDSLARLKAGGNTAAEAIRWEVTIDITRKKQNMHHGHHH